MKKIEINIPERLSEITLMQYQAFIESSKRHEDNPTLINQLMIQYLCGIPLEDVKRLPYSETEFINEKLSSLFSVEAHPFIERFEIGGIEYGFIPDFENITLGEYLDLDETISDVSQWNNSMSVMYRPIVNKSFWKKKSKHYEILPHASSPIWQEAMKYAPLDVVLGSLFFFQNLERDLLESTLNSSLAEVEKLIIQAQVNSHRSGVGIPQFGNLLKETSQDLKKLQSLVSINA